MTFTPCLERYTCKCVRLARLGLLSCVLIICGVNMYGYMYGTETQLPKSVSDGFLNDILEEPCSMPVLDPYDISLRKYIWTPEPLHCDTVPSIVTVDENNVLHLNKSAFDYFHVSSEWDISCTTQAVLRSVDDYEVVFGDGHVLQFPAELKAEFNFVQCKHGDRVVFDNIVAGISDAARDANKPSIGTETDGQLSVHLIGLDSVSRSASIRGLPKTLEYLGTLGSYDFRGAMKIGENTPPNLVGLLTGRVLFTNETISEGRVDGMPFLWKNFTTSRYATLYAEDNRDTNMLNMFTYKGFAEVPTDHYMRPFWIALEKRKFERPKTVLNTIFKFFQQDTPRRRFCEQNTKKSMLTLNYLKRFLIHYKQKRKFSFTFLTDVSHESSNYLPYIDEEIRDFLRWMKEDGLMKKSIVVLFSDHGSRYESLRNTFAGRIESRMPMLHVILPEHIKTRYPEVDTNLKINTQRLVTLFDVYQTLLDVLHTNYGNPSTQIQNGKERGVSLFKQISKSRSCMEADIPSQFCACYKSKAVNLTNNQEFDTVAESLVDHINNMLSDETNCQKLKLNRILSVEKMSFGLVHKAAYVPESSLNRYFTPENIRESHNIVVETKPGLATFDVSCELDSRGTLRVGNVDRTNAYGNQSICVTNKSLRQFCYC